jgi:hypothetical protein
MRVVSARAAGTTRKISNGAVPARRRAPELSAPRGAWPHALRRLPASAVRVPQERRRDDGLTTRRWPSQNSLLLHQGPQPADLAPSASLCRSVLATRDDAFGRVSRARAPFLNGRRPSPPRTAGYSACLSACIRRAVLETETCHLGAHNRRSIEHWQQRALSQSSLGRPWLRRFGALAGAGMSRSRRATWFGPIPRS